MTSISSSRTGRCYAATLSRDEKPGCDEHAEDAEECTRSGQGAVERRAVRALEHRPDRLYRKRGRGQAEQRPPRAAVRGEGHEESEICAADQHDVEPACALATHANR